MSDIPPRITPIPTPETAEYWAGLERHELLLQRCAACGAVQLYPRCLCTSCGGDALGWVRASGRGLIASYSLVRHAVSRAYVADLPYVLLLVRLEEGPLLMSTLVDAAIEDAAIGLAVEVVFDDRPEGYTLPRFRLRR